jgi:hypothetical protein
MGFTIAFANSNNVRFLKSDESTLPCLEIGYMDNSGIKDYWTYNSTSVGFAGTSYVLIIQANLILFGTITIIVLLTDTRIILCIQY